LITRTLNELSEECRDLGIRSTVVPTRNTKEGPVNAKRDYIKALATYYLVERYGDVANTPQNLRYRLLMESPQLAFQFTRLKADEQDAIWETDKWALTEKIDGARMLLIYTPGEGLSAYSRNVSVKDFLPVEYSEQILHTIAPGAIPFPFALDTEVISTNPNLMTHLEGKGVVTETQLQAVSALLAMNTEQSLQIQNEQALDGVPVLEFHLIDVLNWQGVDLKAAPYSGRLDKHAGVVDLLSPMLNIQRIRHCPSTASKEEKLSFHEGILSAAGEGTVAAHMDAQYVASPNRNRTTWVKIKRSAAQSVEGSDDTIDAYISGYKPGDKGFEGMVGALEFSVILQKSDGAEVDHIIAYISGIPLSLRREISLEDGSLDPEVIGRVYSIDGQAISSRAKRLRHARIVCPRPDRDRYTCVLTESFLDEQIL